MFGKYNKYLKCPGGFSLVEVLIIIVVIGIAAGSAVQWMSGSVDDVKKSKTEREMEMLATAIAGNPEMIGDGHRADFGYIGDIGAFPSNLQALYQNPGGYSTWDGPYIKPGILQDNSGYRYDEWGVAYNYSGGLTITSTGSGTTIRKKVADASSDYLLNNFIGQIRDATGNRPGMDFIDSIDIIITIPDGSGGTIDKTYQPTYYGAFTLDSLPVGSHPLRIIYTPTVDTLYRYLAILPRHKSSKTYKFAVDYFSSSAVPDTSHMIVSTSGSAVLGGLSFNDEDLADYDSISAIAIMYLDASTIFSGDEDLDATHILENGHIVLSTNNAAQIGGLSFQNEDLVDYDPIAGTATMLFDGSNIFNGNEDIDAVYVTDSGSILLSTTSSASIGSLNFQDEDIVLYDPVTANPTIYFDGSAHFSNSADINGIFIRSNGHIILSTNQDSRQLGGLTFHAEDLVEYDTATNTAVMFFDGAVPFGGDNQNIDAVHIGDGCGAVATVTCGLVGYWTLDESGGMTAHDISGFGNDGTLHNMIPGHDWVSGKIDGALDFDGSNDYVQIPHANRLNGSTALTYAAWVYPHSWSGVRQVMAKSVHGGGSGRAQMGIFSEGGTLKGRAETDGGRQEITTSLTSLNNWTHVALVFDSVSLTIYIDGSPANTMTFSSTSLIQTTDPLNISKRVGSNQYFFDGVIDDVRVYDCALNAAEIQTLYDMGN